MTAESENVYPFDSSIWEHVEHLDYHIGIPISDTRSLNILEVLHEVYDESEDSPRAQALLIGLAAILVGVKSGHSDKIFEEFTVQEALKDFDEQAKELLNEE